MDYFSFTLFYLPLLESFSHSCHDLRVPGLVNAFSNRKCGEVNEKLRKVLQQFDLIVKDTDGENIHSFSGLL
jgi:hypothetical protein